MKQEQEWKWEACSMTQSVTKQQNNQARLQSREVFSFDRDMQKEYAYGNNFIASIQMSKKFSLEANTGFVWHKSWILPEITVKFDQKQLISFQNLFSKPQLRCELLSVVSSKSYKTNIQKVPFNKQTILNVTSGQVTFSNIKFSKTSFQYKRQRFRLLVLLYAKMSSPQKFVIIDAQISSQLYVDSRREARLSKSQYEQIERMKRTKFQVQTFFQPLRIFNGIKNIKLENNVKGFLDYYSAQNIRNKIKDIFYVAYHFNLAFKCFIDKSKVKNVFQAMKLIESNCTSDIIVKIVINFQNQDEIKRTYNIFDKSFRFKNCHIEQNIFPVNLNNKWHLVTRKQINESYKQFYDDEEQYIYKKNEDVKEQYYEYRTVILLQGGPRKQVKKDMIQVKLQQL